MSLSQPDTVLMTRAVRCCYLQCPCRLAALAHRAPRLTFDLYTWSRPHSIHCDRGAAMGVSCIVLWDPQEGQNPSQTMDILLKRLEKLAGKSLGPWLIDCETLYSASMLAAGGPQKLIHMLHSSEYPRTTFAVLDSMNCLVADNTVDTIFVQLKAFYAPRKGFKIEVKGQHYEVKQYSVKFGAITIGASSKGVIVEVEDKASDRVDICWPALTEFTKGLLAYSHDIDPPNRPIDRPYTPADAMTHHAYIFTQLGRKSGR